MKILHDQSLLYIKAMVNFLKLQKENKMKNEDTTINTSFILFT